MPLVLGFKAGDYADIGDNIRITIVEIQENNVRIVFDAPQEINILRGNAKVRIPVRNRYGSLVSKGVDEDGLCLCGINTPCPLGRKRYEECCTKEELIEAGVPVYEVKTPVDDHKDCHGGHTGVI